MTEQGTLRSLSKRRETQTEPTGKLIFETIASEHSNWRDLTENAQIVCDEWQFHGFEKMLLLTGAKCSPDKQLALLVALRHRFSEHDIWRMFTRIVFDSDFGKELNLSRNEIRLSYLSDAIYEYQETKSCYSPVTGSSVVAVLPKRGVGTHERERIETMINPLMPEPPPPGPLNPDGPDSLRS